MLDVVRCGSGTVAVYTPVVPLSVCVAIVAQQAMHSPTAALPRMWKVGDVCNCLSLLRSEKPAHNAQLVGKNRLKIFVVFLLQCQSCCLKELWNAVKYKIRIRPCPGCFWTPLTPFQHTLHTHTHTRTRTRTHTHTHTHTHTYFFCFLSLMSSVQQADF